MVQYYRRSGICVANHGLQLFHGFCLSKDGMAEGARFESPLRRVVHRENYFAIVHVHNYIP
jgi:hypothetical protein